MNRRQLLTGAACASLTAASLGACGGGGGGSGGTSSGGSSSSSSSASKTITSYAAQAEITVSPVLNDYQEMTTIAGLGNGDFVVAWVDFHPTAPNTYQQNVRVRLYTPSGAARGSDFAAGSFHQDQQIAPSITALAGGDFVVAWQDDTAFIKAQIFSASGTAKGSLISVNTSATQMQRSPRVAGLTDGGFLVAWLEDPTDAYAHPTHQHVIRGQSFTSAGTRNGAEFVISDEIVENATLLRLAALSNGNFVATWDGNGLQARVFTPTGQAVSGVITLRSDKADTPDVAGLVNGGFVAVWQDRFGTVGGDTSMSITAQLFTNGGAASGSVFLVNASSALDQGNPAVASLANGNFVVTWNDQLNDDYGDTTGLRGQVFTADGQKFSTEFAVNSVLTGFQNASVVTGLKNGDFVVAWSDMPITRASAVVKARLFVGQ